MDLLVEIIYQQIEQNEKDASALYRKLVKKFKNPAVKEMLESLMKDELGHEQFFSDFNTLQLRDISDDDLKKLKTILDRFPKIDSDKEEVISVIDKAIKSEDLARQSYELLARNLEGSAHDDLIRLAGQEGHHKLILESIKKQMNL